MKKHKDSNIQPSADAVAETIQPYVDKLSDILDSFEQSRPEWRSGIMMSLLRHGYDDLPGIRKKLGICRGYDRPVLCTEWLHRPKGNTVEAILLLFRAQRIGCWNWGLVYDRTQTYMPWGSNPGDPVPELWQHDFLHPDGTPFKGSEVELIRSLTRGR